MSTPLGFANSTVSNTAVGLPSPPGGSGNKAFIRIENNPVRWRDDGTNPTSSVGHLLNSLDVLVYDGDLTAIKFIRASASDAALTASYYSG